MDLLVTIPSGRCAAPVLQTKANDWAVCARFFCYSPEPNFGNLKNKDVKMSEDSERINI